MMDAATLGGIAAVLGGIAGVATATAGVIRALPATSREVRRWAEWFDRRRKVPEPKNESS